MLTDKKVVKTFHGETDQNCAQRQTFAWFQLAEFMHIPKREVGVEGEAVNPYPHPQKVLKP